MCNYSGILACWYENADNAVEEAYHEERVKRTQELIADIEGDGASEADLREMKAEAEGWLNDYDKDEETPEQGRFVAKHDLAKQALERYFGDDNGPLKLGELVASTTYDGGMVELNGTSRTAVVEVRDEPNAKATADAFLHSVGTSLEDEKRQEVY